MNDEALALFQVSLFTDQFELSGKSLVWGRSKEYIDSQLLISELHHGLISWWLIDRLWERLTLSDREEDVLKKKSIYKYIN